MRRNKSVGGELPASSGLRDFLENGVNWVDNWGQNNIPWWYYDQLAKKELDDNQSSSN